MTHYNTAQTGPLLDAYIAGIQRGISIGALMVMTPSEKNARAYRRQQIAKRLTEYNDNARRLHRHRDGQPWARYWPDDMPGGWPLPPAIPSDDPVDWWPEVGGWPCPPPHLRGPRT